MKHQNTEDELRGYKISITLILKTEGKETGSFFAGIGVMFQEFVESVIGKMFCLKHLDIEVTEGRAYPMELEEESLPSDHGRN